MAKFPMHCASLYVCMYDVGSYTCIDFEGFEGFRLNHDLLNLSLWGTHSCMCVCVCLCVYLHTCMYMCVLAHVYVHVRSWSPMY